MASHVKNVRPGAAKKFAKKNRPDASISRTFLPDAAGSFRTKLAAEAGMSARRCPLPIDDLLLVRARIFTFHAVGNVSSFP